MSNSFSHALLGVDFSPATEPLLTCVPNLMSLGVEKMTLVYVMDIHYPRAPETEHVSHYEKRLGELAATFEAQGVDVDTQVRVGDPAEEVLTAASEQHASVIVVGSHGQNVFGEALLGSVASTLTQKSTLPVLVLAVEAAGDPEDEQCRVVRSDLCTHILHPTDFSSVAERAYAYLTGLGRCPETITLLHVQDRKQATRIQWANLEEYDRLDQARLQRLQADLEGRSEAEVEIRLERGPTARTVVKVAEELEASLIVLGKQGRGYLSEVMLGSASRYVVRHARVPVLLIPAPR